MPASRPDDSNPGARAELYLCLAQAFRLPPASATLSVFAEDLPDDLSDFGRELGLPLEAEAQALRASLRTLPDALSLLQTYSVLFLTPPAPVAINAGRYLDGAAMPGASAEMLERCYRDHGLERDESFRDLPDHLALQLEFTAFLFARAAAAIVAGNDIEAARHEAEAREFLAAFVAPWLPAFCGELERVVAARGLAASYLHLARVLRTVAEHDTAGRLPLEEPSRSTGRAAGMGEPGPEEIAEIARLLAARGHSTDHLAIPLAARDAALGLTRAEPPPVTRHRPAG